MTQMTEFTISGLHGGKSLRIPINNNRLLLVGINGLGKTTVMTMLYLLLSRQWIRLLSYSFDSISFTVDGERQAFGRKDIEAALRSAEVEPLFRRYFAEAGAMRRDILSDVLAAAGDGSAEPGRVEAWAEELGMSPTLLNHLVRRAKDAQGNLFTEEGTIKRADTALRQWLDGAQVVYLPTYRRIERDLKAIFPNIDESLRRFNRRKSPIGNTPNSPQYLELVEFGMEDVDEQFQATMGAARRHSLISLNGLAGNYLRDVIRGEALVVPLSKLLPLSDSEVDGILNRVEEDTLSADDKKKLRQVIAQIRERGGEHINAEFKYLAHYFLKLSEAVAAIAEREAPIALLVAICQKYLRGKSIAFDNKKFEISTKLDGGTPIGLKDLSSGEKQIVSLFSHLLLASRKKYAVLIDEPELSLSVEWQKRLLPDILGTGRCSFLAAATHSPFVFDNQLDAEALDLQDCLVKH